jgi:outer membrane protein assembly factor BamB
MKLSTVASNLLFGLIGASLAPWGTPYAWGQVAIDSFPKIDATKDWPWWRGVTRDGHAVGTSNAPVKLIEGQNLDWSTPIPGRGHGSPIVVGERVYLLTADESSQTHLALAYDRATGNQVWKTQLNQGGFPSKNHPKNTEASTTMASDGERLYLTLFHHEAVWAIALSFDGELVWEERIDRYNPKMYEYGYAPSPIIYGDDLILVYEYDGPSAIVSMNRSNGKRSWTAKRMESISFSSPVVTSYKGKDYLLISGQDSVSAYNPKNGELIWSTKGTAMATCGTAVWHDGVVFASGGYPSSETIAIEMETGRVLWRNRQKAYEQSMVAANGYLYSLTDSGRLYCWDAKTGEEKWVHRLAGPVSASGVLVGDRIYWPNEAGDLWVFKADPKKYTEIAKSKIGDEAFASPVIVDGQVFLRVAKLNGRQRQEYLMRFSGE